MLKGLTQNMLARLQHAGRMKNEEDSESSVDLEEVIQRNKEKVNIQLK